MGFVQPVLGAISQGSAYDAAKRKALIEGEVARDTAYSRATAKGEASKKALHVVAGNMARAAGNKRREMASARVAGMSSGFTSEGSGGKAEELVAKVYDGQMADMARAGSEASMQAFNEQVALRKQGDAAMRAAEIEAQQQRALAKASRTGAWFNAIGGIAGGAIGAYKGISAAFEAGNVSNDDLFKAGLFGGVTGADAGSGFMAAFNPMTSHLASDSWDKYLMSYMGVGNIK